MALDRKLEKRLRKIVGGRNVLTLPEQLAVYGYDASLDRGEPDAVVLVESTEQVAEIVRLARESGVPYVARGSGTSLSGGPVPVRGGVVIEMARMNRVVEVDPRDRSAIVEAGIFNLKIAEVLKPYGFTYAPDPASQKVSSIGGNVAENA
ncbi:MAG TPA: FAD-binding oxidoreductase, partial [Bacteroidetes bacterium]|nr:FAD-binding oxidoreductase [Bacteroidota bacterium]